MPKWFDDSSEFDETGRGRGGRNHRERARGRKRWDDEPEPQPAAAVVRPAYRSPAPSTTVIVPRPVVQAPGPTSERGTVRFFDNTKGFGFVAPDRAGPDLFVHVSTVRTGLGVEVLTQGQAVMFDRGPGRQPGKQAVTRIYPAP